MLLKSFCRNNDQDVDVETLTGMRLSKDRPLILCTIHNLNSFWNPRIIALFFVAKQNENDVEEDLPKRLHGRMRLRSSSCILKEEALARLHDLNKVRREDCNGNNAREERSRHQLVLSCKNGNENRERTRTRKMST